MEEVWKDITDYPNYQVSNLGRVKNKKTGKLKQPQIDRTGYYQQVWLTHNGKANTQRIHRLVAETFLGKHPDLMVNHIDGDKLNNRVTNLEWCTAKENNDHAIRMGLNQPGAYQKRPVRVVETGEIFDGVVKCAEAIGGDFRNVYAALKGDRPTVNGLHFEYADELKPKPRKKESFLHDYQKEAVSKMRNGVILNGGVGSGKSRTGLFYYYKEQGGWIDENGRKPMKNPKDLYIITTAMKRDKLEFEQELSYFLMSVDPELNPYDHNIVIDSWNNIKKYANVENAFFLFDEDKVTGYGVWVKAFLKIAKHNDWIILSATAGDKWEDYIPVFIANGFYKNKTEFTREHFIYSRFSKYPKVDRIINEGRLLRLRERILIPMDFERQTISHHEDIYVSYNTSKYREATRTKKDPYKPGWVPCPKTDPEAMLVGKDITVDLVTPIMNGWDYEPKIGDYVKLTYQPIKSASELCYVWRKIVNTDDSRQIALIELFQDHPKMIVFYNFDYELDILKGIYYGEDVEIAEWNGHKHQPVPDSDSWVYLVQYTAGAEGWNCIKTDTIVFFSQNYSYKVMQQSAGRIDRLNTPYLHLHYYHLKSRSGIDLAISRALKEKKQFNETRYVSKAMQPLDTSMWKAA